MAPADDTDITRTADLVALRALQESYADIVSRQAFAELERIFRPDITVVMDLPGRAREVRGPQAFGEYVAQRISHLEFFRFALTNVVVDQFDDERASGRMHFYELHQDAEHHRLLTLHGCYFDEFMRTEGCWWFAARRFAPLAMTSNDPARDLDVFPSPFVDHHRD